MLFVRESILFTLVASIAVTGCGPTPSPEALERENSHFRWLSMAYMDYTRDNRGKIPEDLGAFKKYVEKHGGQYMSDNNLTIESFFTSPRDNQAYTFSTQEKKIQSSQGVIGYEQQGVGGQRYVADDAGAVREVNDEMFGQLVENGS